MPDNKTIEGLLGASTNPFMNIGSAFLASRYDPSVNPWMTSMESLAMAKKAADLEQDRQRQQQLRQQLGQFFGQGGMGQPPMGAMSPVPPMGSPMPMPVNTSMANQVMPPMTQQQRFGALPYNQQQYLRNMALRDLFDTGK